MFSFIIQHSLLHNEEKVDDNHYREGGNTKKNTTLSTYDVNKHTIIGIPLYCMGVYHMHWSFFVNG